MAEVFETDIPSRLDRLLWGRFHSLVVAALGITWALDGLEVTLAGTVAGAVKASPVMRFSSSDIGFVSSAYLAGAVFGALLFGWLADRMGRRRLFFITLGLYVAATSATALTLSLSGFALCRFLTGAGIGGEYAAVNSAVQELIPARFRGWTDLAINGTFWLGAGIGALSAGILLSPQLTSPDLGWRLCFLIGLPIGLCVLFMRSFLPESPRWLLIHDRVAEAETVMSGIERRSGTPDAGEAPRPKLKMTRGKLPGLFGTFRLLLRAYPRRTLVGLALMAAQAFFYNAIFFTYALVLIQFYGVGADQVGWYVVPFAAGNFLGPLLLGRLFDSIGRRPMIVLTYGLSGIFLLIDAVLFERGALTTLEQAAAWSVIFFFASAAASAAYLTVSETFPLEIRATVIALFYALGTALGGVAGPWLLGRLIETGARGKVAEGYVLGAVLMIAAAAAQGLFGISAERRPLEQVAPPLMMVR